VITMLKTVEGFYQDGQIKLGELPQEVGDRTQVLVTFLESRSIDTNKLCQLIDQLETIANIQQGFEEIDAGQTVPIEDFVQEMQQKYELEGEI
jgi:predicted transcriptional regulator